MPSGLPFIDLGIVLDGLQGALIGPTATVRGTDAVAAKLTQYANAFGDPERFLRAAALTYRKYMVENKLSGQALKRRSGRLAGAWQPSPVDRNTYRLSPGRLPYARIHEYGLNYPQQPVRGYTTRTGKRVRLYLRHMKIRETRYVRDTIIEADSLVQKRLDEVAKRIIVPF